MNIRTTFTIATIPFVLLMVGAVGTTSKAHAWGWGDWGVGYDGYGHYGLFWHENCCNGLSSGTIYRLGYNQGYVDSSNNNVYNCDGHSYTYCNGYSAGFSAGQNNGGPNKNNNNQENQEQQSNSVSEVTSNPNIYVTVNNVIPNQNNANATSTQNSGAGEHN